MRATLKGFGARSRSFKNSLTVDEKAFLRSDVITWLAMRPLKVREAIFLILDGHECQDHRAHVKGAQTARARRKGAA